MSTVFYWEHLGSSEIEFGNHSGNVGPSYDTPVTTATDSVTSRDILPKSAKCFLFFELSEDARDLTRIKALVNSVPVITRTTRQLNEFGL